jgi:hypothetical protein
MPQNLEWARFSSWNSDIARKIIVMTPAADALPRTTTKRENIKKGLNAFENRLEFPMQNCLLAFYYFLI